MTQSAPVLPLTPDSRGPYSIEPERPQRRWGLWFFILLVVLLLHFLTFLTHVGWMFPQAPSQIEVEQINPQKLEEIRKKWQAQEHGQQKQLFIDKNPATRSNEKAPDHAHYMSDRNIHVEKEQRARRSVVLPKPGTNTHHESTHQEKQARHAPRSALRSLPKLGNLGVPFHLSNNLHPKYDSERMAKNDSSSDPPGGDQYIDDKNLPTGSENLLNTEESVYYSFYARLYDAIGPLWSSRLRELTGTLRVNPGDYITSVDVVLDRHGNLIQVRLLGSSGVHEFDQAVDSAWHQIGKFPNPPSGLIKSDGNVHTGWSFKVEVGSGGGGLMLLPPERTD